MRLARFLVASIATLAVGSFGNFAIGQTWEGDSTLDAPLFYYWSDGSNWLLDSVPNSSSIALFGNNGANSKNIDFAGGTNIANGVRFAAGSSAYTFRPFSGVGLQLQGTNSFLENLGGNNQQINAGVTFSGAGSKTISSTSTGGLQFNGSVSNTAAAALTISKSGTGAISFTGPLTSNSGLAITNSNTGNVTIGAATVSGSTVSVGGSGNTSFTGTLTNSAGLLTLTKAGAGTLSTSGISSAAGVSLSNTGTGATTIGSITNSSGNVSISNSAAATLNVGAITGGGNLQITNSDATGVVRFNNNVGASTVSFSGGGRVEVASGVTVSGTTTVSGAGSSLTGLGSFGNAVVIQNGGTLSPGVDSGAGTQSFNGGLAFDSGSKFSWNLVNETTGFDSVIVSGGSGLSINSGATSVLNISNAITESFWNTNQSWNVFTGTFAAPGSVFGNITLAGAAPDVTKGFFTWTSSTNGVTLNFTAVPEPSSMALLGLAGVIGGVYARRRNKLTKNATVAC